MISFIIPTYEKINFTKSCLEDLSKLIIDFEVIIVDNSKTNDTELFCKSFNKIKNFKYIKCDKNLFTRACNLGYKKSTYDYVCFLNNDIRVKDNFDNWPLLLINKLNLNDNAIIGDTGGLIDKGGNFVYETRDNTKKINYISGWLLTINKKVAKLLENENGDLFDDRVGFYFSETELCFRATKKGVKLIMQNVPLTHFGKISTDRTQINKLYKEGRSAFLEIVKEKKYML